MTKEKALKILNDYIEKHGEIPSVFTDLKLAEAVLLLEDELEDIINGKIKLE